MIGVEFKSNFGIGLWTAYQPSYKAFMIYFPLFLVRFYQKDWDTCCYDNRRDKSKRYDNKILTAFYNRPCFGLWVGFSKTGGSHIRLHLPFSFMWIKLSNESSNRIWHFPG